MHIIYNDNLLPDTESIIKLYKSSGLIRPINDHERIAMMYKNSNLIITAWHDNELVGIARSLTDFCYACYLSDLAVSKAYQRYGIGKQLIKLTKEKVGEKSNLLLLSAPSAMEYYPKIGFQKADHCFLIKRNS